MAHEGQFDFCNSVRNLYPEYFFKKRVLEAGSLNINGTIRTLFEDCEYVGIDLGEGSCVDVVCKAHEYTAPDCYFDTICSCEMFEHDMYLPQTLQNLMRMLKPNGLFFFTCATTGRVEHGTVRANDSYSSPFTCSIPEWSNFYKNLTESDIRQIIDIESTFSKHKFAVVNEGAAYNSDLYFWGVKASPSA